MGRADGKKLILDCGIGVFGAPESRSGGQQYTVVRGSEQAERHVGLDSPQNSPRGNLNDLRPIDGSKPVVTVQLRKAGDFEVSSNRSTPLHPTQATANPMLK